MHAREGPVTEDALRAAARAWPAPATLPGSAYTDRAVFERERARLFHGGWFCLGRAADAPNPGAVAVCDVAGESVLLARGADGTLRAFLNVCRHRGARLCDTAAHGLRAIVCPYHAWSYGLDGRLIGTPNVGRDERLPRERLGLHEVALAVHDGFAWVALAGSAEPLPAFLERTASDDPFQWARYGVGDLVEGARHSYDVAANWKLVIENYNECLHCPSVHPELVQIVPLYRRGEVEEPGWNGNRLGDGRVSFTPSGTSGLPLLSGLADEDVGAFYGITLLPNLIVNYHSDVVSTFLLQPLAPDRTHVVCHFLFRPETVAAPGFDPSAVVGFRDLLARQDWAVCERAQQGAGSRGFAEGGVLPWQDRYLHAFHERYRALLDPSG